MSVKINYEYETVTIPAKAISAMERAAAADIRLLMALCADSKLRRLPENDFAAFARAAGCSEAQAAAAMAFWRGAGILITDRTTEGSGDVGLPSSPSYGATVAEEVLTSPASPVAAEPAPVAAPWPDTSDAPAESVTPPTSPARETTSSGGQEPVRTPKPARHDQLPIYTSDQISGMLEAHPDTAEFLDESARVWGKMFNTHEINILLGLVDYLGLDWEYVLILLAYCKKIMERRGSSKSLHYVETVAFNFYDEGIHTSEELQEKIRQLDLMAETEGRLRTMFGLGGRALSATEKRYFSVWLYEYKYSVEIIQKAYEITVDTIGEPKLKYINSILSKWAAEKLETAEAIDVYQQESDRAHGKAARERRAEGSFDTDDFFGDAVRRNFGDDPGTDPAGT